MRYTKRLQGNYVRFLKTRLTIAIAANWAARILRGRFIYAVSILKYATFLKSSTSNKQGVSKMRRVLLAIILSILFFHVSSSYAGSRGNSESWDLTYDPTSSFWTHEHMLSSASTAASHFFHEFKNNKRYRDFKRNHKKNRGRRSESLDFVELRFWKKFKKRDDHDWDNFHFKKNKHYYDDDSDDSDSDFKGQSPPVAPEPASALLFLSGAPVIIYRRYVKKIKKTDIAWNTAVF